MGLFNRRVRFRKVLSVLQRQHGHGQQRHGMTSIGAHSQAAAAVAVVFVLRGNICSLRQQASCVFLVSYLQCFHRHIDCHCLNSLHRLKRLHCFCHVFAAMPKNAATLSQGYNGSWLQDLQACKDMKAFAAEYQFHAQALKTGFPCVKKVRKQTTGRGEVMWFPQLACKCYERNDTSHLQKWASEVRIYRTLGPHQNIVWFRDVYFEVSHDLCRCFLLFDLCRESLWDYMHHFKRCDGKIVQVFGMDMCKGLQQLHDHSILHRDMKPRHCLLKQEGARRQILKICDFGNSVWLADNEQQFTNIQPLAHTMTTAQYTSPEVVHQKPYGLPADMWSIGVILWELLQDDATVAAVKCNDKQREVDGLMSALDSYRKAVEDTRQDSRATSPLVRLAMQLVEFEPDDRPTAVGAVKQLESMGALDVVIQKGEAVGSDEASPDQGQNKPLMGPRGGVQEDAVACGQAGQEASHTQNAAGTEREKSSNQAQTPVQLTGHPTLAMCAVFKPFMKIPQDLVAFVDAAEQLGRHTGNVLFLYTLSIVRYPTVVQHLGSRFAALQSMPPHICSIQEGMLCVYTPCSFDQ